MCGRIAEALATMGWRHDLGLITRVARPQKIARRYFVTNGFDGALASLGLVTGFYVGEPVALRVALGACVGLAVALGMSGLSSAYVSEAAERQRELDELRSAMVSDLEPSAHARAARWVPLMIAIVNGLAPVVMAAIVALPLALALSDIPLPADPLLCAMALAMLLMFSLGAFLGRVSGEFWLWSALRTLVIALATAGIILLLDV